MEEWQNRVVEERADLDSKLLRLTSFIKSPKFKELEDEDQNLLLEQSDVMMNYSFVLYARIARWGV